MRKFDVYYQKDWY